MAFSLRPTCVKCGTERFEWHWYLPDQFVKGMVAINAPQSNEEHLLLSCENCGWSFPMKPKDAS